MLLSTSMSRMTGCMTTFIFRYLMLRRPWPIFHDSVRSTAESKEKGGADSGDLPALPLEVLLNLDQFTSSNQVPAFYGQSASLKQFLCHCGGMEQVIRFTIDSQQMGYSKAFQNHYQIASIDELKRQWKHSVYDVESFRLATNTLQVKFTP